MLALARPSSIDLAQGWPAVLGLASVSEAALPDLTSAPHLFGFFADEIYRRIDQPVRQALCELALYDTEGRHLALSQMPSDVVEQVVAVGLDSGFLTELHDKRLDMHPLLRTFLQRKVEDESARSSAASVETAAGVLMAHRLWDEAFDLMRRFKQEHLIPVLIAASMDELLTSGRAATLHGWIAQAPESAPIVRLATAELAFREGRYSESESLAALAARDLDDRPESAAHANLVAGRSAHVASREEEARAYYEQGCDDR